MRSGNERFMKHLIVLYCKFTYFCESNKGLLFVFRILWVHKEKAGRRLSA